MRVTKIYLKGFRNHNNLLLELESDTTLIIGNNGVGKTNVLEAIHLAATTKSIRTHYDREMISHNENAAYVQVIANISNEPTKLEISLLKSEKFTNASSKQVKINSVKKTVNAFAGTINTVMFAPSDIEVFAGSPGNRRKYLDSIFFQLDNDYKRAFTDYTKALKQRNKVLESIKEYKKGQDQLEFWDIKLIDTGSIIQNKRMELFEFINSSINSHAQTLNETPANVYINYLINEVSKERIKKYKEKELIIGKTMLGPHKDDFEIILNNYAIANYGSRGQQRMCLLALKLCEIDFIHLKTKKRPILLLDDIFSELDDPHKKAIWGIVNLQQTIITAAEPVDNINSAEIAIIELT